MDAAAFLNQYGFELQRESAQEWVQSWERRYPKAWVSSALVEALYRGRYKAVSVEQLLGLWKSRGCPCLGASLEFGRKVWPDNLERLQVVLEEGAHNHQAQVRGYAFESFDITKSQAIRVDGPITTLPLCQHLRRQSLPSKLQELLLIA